MNHEWDGPSRFCTRCGCGEIHVIDGTWHADCIDPAPNVVAVSHLIAHRRNAWVEARLREHGLYPDGPA